MDNASRSTAPDPDAAQLPVTKPDPSAPNISDLSGTTLGDFHLLRRLGQGGMGQVYLAEQLSLKRKVALKIMRPEVAGNAVSLQRFKAEAEAVARVNHANIVQVYAVGEVQGVHFIALEYVEGRNLRDFVARKGPPEVLQALSIMRQVAAALQRASEMGIIHRDVKPENILLTRKGEVKVADFGLSRCFGGDQPALHLTQTGIAMGTPLYMSPEQVEGKPLDPRTDIYSLGVTCYHMLAGQPPFRGETSFQIALQHVQSEPTPLQNIRPDLPAELGAMVHKMLAKDPAQRYQTCRDLLKDLARLRDTLAGQRTQALDELRVPPAPSRATEAIATPAPERLRHVLLLAGAAGSLLLASALGALLGWARSRPVATPPTPPRPTPATADESIGGLFSAAEREQFLKIKVQELANPGRDAGRRQQGVEFALELGLIYVNQWRLDEAERFFSELINNPHKVKEYVTVGKVGRACVLAFRNNPSESNRLLRELASDRKLKVTRFDQFPSFLAMPQLCYLIARALEYNAANATQDEPFPPDLEYLRRPPMGGAGVRRGDKPGNKN